MRKIPWAKLFDLVIEIIDWIMNNMV